MADNDDIQVQEDGTGELLDVRTVLIDGKHYPVFINANGDGELIGNDSNAAELHSFSRKNELLENILIEMKILNKYMSSAHDMELTQSDVED